jgi:hypothetical protein
MEVFQYLKNVINGFCCKQKSTFLALHKVHYVLDQNGWKKELPKKF